MRVLDTNIVIYATQPGNEWLRNHLLTQPFGISVITVVEVLGWHKITQQDEQDLELFLNSGSRFPITDTVIRQAVRLRQQKKMSLGDAFIAATALDHGCELVTRNTDDFKHISGLALTNPFPPTF